MEERKKTKKLRKILLVFFGLTVCWLLFVLLYRKVRFQPILDAVNGDSIKTENGDYTCGAWQKDFPSLGGNLYVNHYIAVNELTNETLTYGYCDADLYPKLFGGFEIVVHLCYGYEKEDGTVDIRRCSMQLDEEMNYLDGDYGSAELYQQYFAEVQEVYRVIADVWGIVTVKESLD